jgi:hypothetical protein
VQISNHCNSQWKNSLNHGLKICYFYFVIHFCNTASYVSQIIEMLSAVRWICGRMWLCWKSFFVFARWSTRVLVEECTSHYPSICNLFKKIRCFKYKARESDSNMRLFDALLHFGTYLSATSNEVYWKHIWITTEKNLLNITYLSEDFGVPQERHFFVTSHGESACDGVGGTLKRLAAKATLQWPYNDQVMMPHQLYGWA